MIVLVLLTPKELPPCLPLPDFQTISFCLVCALLLTESVAVVTASGGVFVLPAEALRW
jgi:hypothetical protein